MDTQADNQGQAGKTPSDDTICAKCSQPTPKRHSRCQHCGAHLYVTCNDCGHRNERAAAHCVKCGRRLHRPLWRKLARRLGKSGPLTVLFVAMAALVLLAVFALVIWFARLIELTGRSV